jgi:glycogen synthase
MRILVLSWEYPPYVVGGMGKHVTELLPALGGQRAGDEIVHIDLITPHYAGGALLEQANEWITIHRVVLPPADPRDLYNSVIVNNTLLVEYASRLGESQHFDLIHLHDWLTGAAGIALKHLWKVPLLATIHATERGRHQGNITSSLSAQIDQLEWHICFEAWRVIVCSQYMRGEVNRFFGTPADKVDVIANGVAPAAEPRLSLGEKELLRNHYAPHGEKLLFYVGRITYEKGSQVLLRAMPRILVDHPNTRLLVAGRNSEKLYPQAYELGIERAVDFLGYVSDHERDHLHQVVDAAIFPSLYEPFGIVALEAMIQGCNVIVSNVGGLAEVVGHERNGLTVYPNDPLSIAWAVNQLFADPVAAAQRRQVASRFTIRLYRWEDIAAQTAQLYLQIIRARQQVNW